IPRSSAAPRTIPPWAGWTRPPPRANRTWCGRGRLDYGASMDAYDLLIIGGGINGTAIAAEAAARGLTVLLVEQGDLGSGTSAASSKLIHGGLRSEERRVGKEGRAGWWEASV